MAVFCLLGSEKSNLLDGLFCKGKLDVVMESGFEGGILLEILEQKSGYSLPVDLSYGEGEFDVERLV